LLLWTPVNGEREQQTKNRLLEQNRTGM